MLTDTEYTALTATEIATAVCAGELSASETVEAALRRVEQRDGDIRAFCETWPDQARRAAAHIDAQVARGIRLPLAGTPIGVKATEGVSSFQSERLMAAGCIPIGSTSVPNRTAGWQTFGHTDRGPTTNPANPEWSPGGSSAGSAAAVAARMVPLATGSDGAGSVRIPAAWCGIIGFKPTNGLLPARDAAGLNTPGPLVRTAADAAAYLEAVTGTSHLLNSSPTRCTVAWSATLGFADVHPSIAQTAYDAFQSLVEVGLALPVDVDIALHDPAPAWSVLRRGMDRPHMVTELVSDNHQRLDEIFRSVDLIATPTTPYPPHGHDGPGDHMSVALTWAFNISGHPAISLPAGTTSRGEPAGLQLIAGHKADDLLLRIAADAAFACPDLGLSQRRT
ncbi:amidase [Streptomyces sp. SPB074]|uniref:amidase n=1 Tax=Streptomyces sp. (strain SPB074) TaxID=465543 RepID=UPI000680E9C2|nr:amidase [Streptomyces sp. SPB074]